MNIKPVFLRNYLFVLFLETAAFGAIAILINILPHYDAFNASLNFKMF